MSLYDTKSKFETKPVLAGNETHLKKDNFYEDDLLLKNLLKERLNTRFFEYADK